MGGRLMNAMQIISLDNTSDSTGGAELSNFDVLCQLRKRGHSITVLAKSLGDLVPKYEENGIPVFLNEVTHVRSHDLRGLGDCASLIWSSLKYGRRGKDGQKRVVYSNDWKSLPLAYAMSRIGSCRMVQHIRIGLGDQLCRQFRFPLQYADMVIGNSKATCDSINHMLKQDKCELVYNGINLRPYMAIPRVYRGDCRILYAGRITPQKGPHLLIKAFAIVHRMLPKSTLFFAGNVPDCDRDYYAQLASEAERLKIPVRFLGHVPDMVGLMSEMDVLVVPSIWQEAFGRVIVEALASGIPAVATNVGGIPEVLGANFSRLLAKSDDPQSLADSVMRAFEWLNSEKNMMELWYSKHQNLALSAPLTKLSPSYWDWDNVPTC